MADQKTLSAEAKPFVPGGGAYRPPGPGPRTPPSEMPNLGSSHVPLPPRGYGGQGMPPHHSMHQQPPMRGYGPPHGGFSNHHHHGGMGGPPSGPPHHRPPPGSYSSPTIGHAQHHMPHPHHGPVPTSPVPEQRPYFVLMTGVPCSGKTSVAKEIARKENFTYVANDTSLKGYTELEKILRGPKQSLSKGYVLDDFLLTNKEDAYYLVRLLTKHKHMLDMVVYLELPLNEAAARAAGGQLTWKHMASHTAHYDAGMEYFGTGNLMLRPLDLEKRTVPNVVEEIVKELYDMPPASRDKISLPLMTLFKCSKLVEDVSAFIELRQEIWEGLAIPEDPEGGPTCTDLTSAGSILDYKTFVRKNHALRRYMCSANFQGDRVYIAKRGKDVFLMPEKQNCVYQLDGDQVPTSFQIEDDFVLDGIGVELNGETKPSIFICDILSSSKIKARNAARAQRDAVIDEILKGVPKGCMFLKLPSFHLTKVDEWLNREWKFNADGLIFYPPGPYQCGIDKKLYIFDFPAETLVTFRVWDSKEVTLDPAPPPAPRGRPPAVAVGWGFSAYCLDENGVEAPLRDPKTGQIVQVQVSSEMAEKLNINDGNLLDYKRVVPESKGARAPKGPSPYWAFFRRSNLRAKPSLASAAIALMSPPDWNREGLTLACCSMKSRDPTAPESS